MLADGILGQEYMCIAYMYYPNYTRICTWDYQKFWLVGSIVKYVTLTKRYFVQCENLI